jgi:hypothetical protein
MAVISLVFSGTQSCAKVSLGGGISTESMEGFEPLTPVVGVARRLAVDGNELMPVWPQCHNPIFKAAAEQGWIDPIDEAAHPALAGYPMVKLREPPQEGEMVLAPGDDIVEIVARSDGGAGHQQQDLMQWIEDPPGFARVIKLRKMLQKQTPNAPAESPHPRSCQYRRL